MTRENQTAGIEAAREVAASYYREIGIPSTAKYIASGKGDAGPAVQCALRAITAYLAAEPQQTEPVRWQVKLVADSSWLEIPTHRVEEFRRDSHEVRPLYATPASQGDLINRLEKDKADIERVGKSWRFPIWEEQSAGQWFFLQDGNLVGEVYDTGTYIKWHCKTSDWRDTSAKTIEQAKAECEASFWKEEWYKLRSIISQTNEAGFGKAVDNAAGGA